MGELTRRKTPSTYRDFRKANWGRTGAARIQISPFVFRWQNGESARCGMAEIGEIWEFLVIFLVF